MSTDTMELKAKATQMGTEAGNSAGSWVIDGNTSNDFCEKVIDGCESGDPEIMDMCPSPLSGEFADDPTVGSVLRELGIGANDHERCNCTDELIDHYEDSFGIAWWATVLRACYIQCGYEPCGVCGNFGHKWKEHV